MIRRTILIILISAFLGGASMSCNSHNKPYLLPNHRL